MQVGGSLGLMRARSKVGQDNLKSKGEKGLKSHKGPGNAPGFV